MSAPADSPRWLRPLGTPGRDAAALLALCVALRAPSFVRDYLSDDEAIYAVIGRALASGARLYVDAVDHKPPAVYWLYGAAHRLAGDGGAMLLLHVLVVFVVWATALTVGAIVRRCAPDTPNADRVAALFYVAFTTTMMPFDSLAANCELWMMLPACLAMWLVLDARVNAARALLAGALLSMAGAFKYQAAVEAPVLLGLLLFARGVPTLTRVGRAGAAFVGLAVPWLAMLAWFGNAGDLGEALYWFRFNFAYVGAGSTPSELVQRAVPRIALVVIPAGLLYSGAYRGVAHAWRDQSGTGRWIIAWTALSVIAVAAGGRFFGHYFHQLTAPLAVLAAPIVAGFVARRPRTTLMALALPALGFWGMAWGQRGVTRVVGTPEPDYAAVVRWLDARDSERGSLCVWGNSPLLAAMAQRPMGCRFVFANYQTGLSPATKSQSDPSVDASPNVVDGAWPRLLDDLNVRRPEFIVDGSPGNVGYYGKFPPEKYADLWEILRRDYEVIGTVEGMRVFRRRRGG